MSNPVLGSCGPADHLSLHHQRPAFGSLPNWSAFGPPPCSGRDRVEYGGPWFRCPGPSMSRTPTNHPPSPSRSREPGSCDERRSCPPATCNSRSWLSTVMERFASADILSRRRRRGKQLHRARPPTRRIRTGFPNGRFGVEKKTICP